MEPFKTPGRKGRQPGMTLSSQPFPYTPSPPVDRSSTADLSDEDLGAAVADAYCIHLKFVRRGKHLISQIYGQPRNRMARDS